MWRDKNVFSKKRLTIHSIEDTMEDIIKKDKTWTESINKIISKDRFWVILMSIITFVVCAWYVPQRASIYLASDEFTLYVQAAFLTGFDWSVIASYWVQTQPGYPLVFLLPLFLIFGDNTLAIYQVSLYINALLAASIVPLSYYILTQWGINKLKADWIYIPVIFMASLAGCVIGNSILGVSEVLLIVLSFALTALLLRIKEKGASHKLSMLFAFLLFYGFACHMRFLGVTGAGALVFLIMVIMKEIKVRYLLSFFAAIIGVIIIYSYAIEHIYLSIWATFDSSTATISDGTGISMSSEIFAYFGNVIRVFQLRNLIAFFRVICGQLWYLGLASFLLVYFGVYVYFKEFFRGLRGLIKHKKTFEPDYSATFIILGFVATFLISTISGITIGHEGYNWRGDALIHGRYNTIIFIPVILYALHTIISKKGKYSISLLVISVGFLIMSFYVRRTHALTSTPDFILPWNVINYILLPFGIARNSIAALIGFTGVAVSGLLLKKRILLAIAIVPLILFNVMAGYKFISESVIPFDNAFIGLNDLNEFKKEDKAYIYPLLYTGVYNTKMQMSLPRTELLLINRVTDIKDNNVILVIEPRHYLSRDVLENLRITNMHYLNKGRSSMIVALDYEVGYTTGSMELPLFMFYTQNGEIQETSVTSNGNLGYMLYGPYATMEQGEYIITAEFTLLDNVNSLREIGAVDLATGGDISRIGEVLLEESSFINGQYSLEFRVELDKTYHFVEFRILTLDGVILQVSDITISIVQP